MKQINRLPDAELAVMQAVWSFERAVSRLDIETVLEDSYPMAPTTILTLLSRLEERGFLQVTKHGRSNRYTPLIKRANYLASQSRSFLDKLCGGDMQVFATALNDSGLSPEDKAELRRLLDEEAL